MGASPARAGTLASNWLYAQIFKHYLIIWQAAAPASQHSPPRRAASNGRNRGSGPGWVGGCWSPWPGTRGRALVRKLWASSPVPVLG